MMRKLLLLNIKIKTISIIRYYKYFCSVSGKIFIVKINTKMLFLLKKYKLAFYNQSFKQL